VWQDGTDSKCPPRHQLPIRWRRYAEENQNRTIEAHHILISQAPAFFSQLGFEYGRDLIDHQPARGTEPVSDVRFDCQTKQRRFHRVSSERADSNGICVIEPIILNDYRGTRFARIVLTARNRPNLAPSHSAFQAEIESTKS
jgi:hypothetical protein